MFLAHCVVACFRRGAALLQMLCGYAERFSALLEGHSEDMPLSELMGGARIRHIFQVCWSLDLRCLCNVHASSGPGVMNLLLGILVMMVMSSGADVGKSSRCRADAC
eukprot:GHUV01035007.1.p2 GENE.GHUV01035007.1~~GHUV01035007.1.p2  ORF type:complete len:107 (-),score=19.69 GHUV01035007.1:223-543(-)